MKLGSERIQGGIKTEEEQSEEKKTLLTQTVQRQKQTCAWAYIMTLFFSNNCFQTLSVFHVNEGKSELFKELLEGMCRVRQR